MRNCYFLKKLSLSRCTGKCNCYICICTIASILCSLGENIEFCCWFQTLSVLKAGADSLMVLVVILILNRICILVVILCLYNPWYSCKGRRKRGKYFIRLMNCKVLSSLSLSLSLYIYIYIYTGCPRRKEPNFGKVFLRSNYTDITRNTYIQSSMVTEI